MAEATVLKYVEDTNRPWNITNVVVRCGGVAPCSVLCGASSLARASRHR
jgi:hypothetical protein